MMKHKIIPLSGAAVLLLGSCVLVPSYPVESYAGSLDKCLDIQGTYENFDYSRPDRIGDMTFAFIPKRFFRRADNDGFQFIISAGERKGFFQKTWITFQFSDKQSVKVTAFNEEKQVVNVNINMVEKDEELQWWQEEKFTCDSSSWQMSYTTTAINEGGRDKIRNFVKITKQKNGSLKKEIKIDKWGGRFGLYRLKDGGEGDTYYRKVDLTFDDVLAGNEKAQQAIKQYEAAKAEAARLRKELQSSKTPQ